MVAGLVGKLGAVLSCIPTPVLGGIFLTGFGMVTSLGLSYLKFVDLGSARNLVVLGISFTAGMAIPAWMNNNSGIIDTGQCTSLCLSRDAIVMPLTTTTFTVQTGRKTITKNITYCALLHTVLLEGR